MSKVKLSELKKRLEEEKKKRQEQQSKMLDGTKEPVEILAIDMSYTTGGLAILHTIGDGYVIGVNPVIREIESILRSGKVVRVKGYRVIASRRLTEISSYEPVEDPEFNENMVWEGWLEPFPPRLRFQRGDGTLYWIDMGSINYERAIQLKGGTYSAFLVPSLAYVRQTNDGRTFNRIKGFYFVLSESETQPAVETPLSPETPPIEGSESETETEPVELIEPQENMPDQIEV